MTIAMTGIEAILQSTNVPNQVSCISPSSYLLLIYSCIISISRYHYKLTLLIFQKHCSTSSSVCGHNGETYPSECAALADRTTVDYVGPCRIIGHFLGIFIDFLIFCTVYKF